MKRRLILLSPLALSACGGLLPAPSYIPRTNWPLQPTPPATEPPNPAGPILLIRAIAAAPGLDVQGIRALAADGSLTVDYYNLWAVNPADAATQALIAFTQASGAFAAIVSPGTRLTPSLILEGELTEFLADTPASTFRAALSIVVIKNSPGLASPDIPLTQQTLTASIPLTSTTPSAEAAAGVQALASLATQAVAVLRQQG
jgi:cholesterol transport system auxiliary component